MFGCCNWQGRELRRSARSSGHRGLPRANAPRTHWGRAMACLSYASALLAVLWCRGLNGLAFNSLMPGFRSPRGFLDQTAIAPRSDPLQQPQPHLPKQSAEPDRSRARSDGEALALGYENQCLEPELIERWHPMQTWRCDGFWAREKLHHVCVKRLYPWIECVRRDDADGGQPAADAAALGLQYFCAAGRNGMVIWVEILNEPETFRVEVYRNAPERTRGLELSERHRVRPEVHPRIHVLMKFVNPEAEKTNRVLSLDTKRTLLEKETSRGRAIATSVELAPGVPLAPAWYDVVEVGTKQQHPVTESAFFFEKFNGITSSDALHLIVSSETLSLRMGVARLVRHATRLVNPSQQSAARNLLDPVFDSVVLWSRQRLSLLDALLALTEGLNVGHGLSHCDLHMNNIMVLESSPWGSHGLPPIADFLRFLYGGAFISPPLRFLVGDDSDGLNDVGFQTAWRNATQKGFGVYDLHLANLRVIDTSHTLNVSSMVHHIKGGTKRTVMIPCRMDRGTSEDIFEMLRAVDMCLLLKTARQNLREAAPLLDRWRSLVSSSQQEFPAVFRDLAASAVVQKDRRQFEALLQSLDAFFATLHRDILNLSGIRECNGMQNEFNTLLKKLQPQDVVKRFFSRSFTERLYWWSTLHHHCSVQSAEDGVQAARRLIAQRAVKLKEDFFSDRIQGVYDVFLNEPYRNPRARVQD